MSNTPPGLGEGGPAFPVPIGPSLGAGGAGSPVISGMSLRDYLAGQALVGMLAGRCFVDQTPNDRTMVVDGNKLTKMAYAIANAMIMERAK